MPRKPKPLLSVEGDLEVRVTTRHIKSGARESYSTCPIALAVQESTGLYCEVKTNPGGLGYVVIERGPGEGENCVSYELPDDANRAACRFDETGKMKAFTLRLAAETREPSPGGLP
jgi:hypothetical protein